MSEMYKTAAQLRLRFPSAVGELTAEQLFQLPLKSASGCDLDTIARAVNSRLKEVTTESFVEDVKPNPHKARLELALDIVKDVIATKQAEAATLRAREERTRKRQKLNDLIAAKKDEALSASSVEELQRQLAALSDD